MPEALHKEVEPGPGVIIRKPVEVTKSLTDQYALYERCGRELRDRLRREQLTIIADHDRRWAEIKREFDSRISETVAMLEQERTEAQAQLIEQYRVRKNEIGALLARLEE